MRCKGGDVNYGHILSVNFTFVKQIKTVSGNCRNRVQMGHYPSKRSFSREDSESGSPEAQNGSEKSVAARCWFQMSANIWSTMADKIWLKFTSNVTVRCYLAHMFDNLNLFRFGKWQKLRTKPAQVISLATFGYTESRGFRKSAWGRPKRLQHVMFERNKIIEIHRFGTGCALDSKSPLEYMRGSFAHAPSHWMCCHLHRLPYQHGAFQKWW